MLSLYAGLADHLQGDIPISTMSKTCGQGNLRAYRDEVVVLSIVEACMKRKDKVISTKLSKSSLLINDGAAGDFSAG